MSEMTATRSPRGGMYYEAFEVGKLYRHTLRVTSGNAVAHHGLGSALARQGKSAEATIQFKEALRIDPNYSYAQENLQGLMISSTDAGQLQEGQPLLRSNKLSK